MKHYVSVYRLRPTEMGIASHSSFVRGGKSDPRDALAICEAAKRPGLHPVPIKSLTRQDLQSLHRVRQQHVEHSTGIANQIRGIAHEYGVCFPIGLKRLCRELPYALEDAENGLTTTARELLARRLDELLTVREEIKRTSQRIVLLAGELPAWPRLLDLPGFGVMVTSSYLSSIGDGRQFKCGRQVSAWLGLVPRQHGTGPPVRHDQERRPVSQNDDAAWRPRRDPLEPRQGNTAGTLD